jgi:hypothetical protein
MRRFRIWRRTAVVACMGAGLAAPSGAVALSTHSATVTTPNSAGVLVATAKCGANEHVVSGGFVTPQGTTQIVSRAVHGDMWTVHNLEAELGPLTAYAYCARDGQLSISTHTHKVTAVASVNTTATARCASGETLVSGGYVMSPPSATNGNSPTFRDYAVSASEWTVMSVFDTPPGSLAAFAYCQRGAIVKVRSSSSNPIPHGLERSATASCHKGETLLGGGYTTTPKPDWFNKTGPDFFYNASRRSGPRSWTASAHNYSHGSGKITAFAYCAA